VKDSTREKQAGIPQITASKVEKDAFDLLVIGQGPRLPVLHLGLEVGDLAEQLVVLLDLLGTRLARTKVY